MKQISPIYTFTSGVVTSLMVIIGSKHYEAESSHTNWKAILDAVRNDDADAFIKAIDIKSTFENYVEGNITIVGGEVKYGNERLHGVVIDRIFDFMKNDLPVRPILKFLNRLYANPSMRAINELYNFLQHKNLPITSDGMIRAYKGLCADYYSVTAARSGGITTLIQGKVKDGRIYNGVGETIECRRNQVDDVADRTCSYGLHAGSYEYASGFASGKLVIVEIDPADVISIPTDCNGQKLRTCKYTVVEECVAPLNNVYVKTNDVDYSDNYEAEDEDDDIEAEEESQRERDFKEGSEAGYDDAIVRTSYDAETAWIMSSAEYEDSFKEGYAEGYGEGVRNRV